MVFLLRKAFTSVPLVFVLNIIFQRNQYKASVELDKWRTYQEYLTYPHLPICTTNIDWQRLPFHIAALIDMADSLIHFISSPAGISFAQLIQVPSPANTGSNTDIRNHHLPQKSWTCPQRKEQIWWNLKAAKKALDNSTRKRRDILSHLEQNISVILQNNNPQEYVIVAFHATSRHCDLNHIRFITRKGGN